jgi:CP family cyanate transporter-like MFS transporter
MIPEQEMPVALVGAGAAYVKTEEAPHSPYTPSPASEHYADNIPLRRPVNFNEPDGMADKPTGVGLRSKALTTTQIANLETKPLTGVAPLIGQIRADTGISNAVAGLLTTLPLLAFGLLSPIAPRVARRFGIERALLASLLVLASGILLRWAGAVAALFLGTAVLGAAIAVANVLLPSLIKREFPERAGLMTSVYSTSLGISAALAAGVSVPLTQLGGIGWREALAVWTLPALLAGVAWLPQLGRSDRAADPSAGSSPGIKDVWRSPLAWQVTLFMGLQSLAYYVTLTWLPEILQEEGMGAARAGWMLGLSQAVAIVTMFLAPMIAERRPSQRGVVVVAVSISSVGALGLLVAGPTASTLWVVLLGLGQGRPSAWPSPSSRYAPLTPGTPQRCRAWPSRSVI